MSAQATMYIAGKGYQNWVDGCPGYGPENPLSYDSFSRLKLLCIKSTKSDCSKPGCDRPHVVSWKTQVYGLTFYGKTISGWILAYYNGAPLPDGFDGIVYSEFRSPFVARGCHSNPTGLVVPYTPPTAEELHNQPQLGSSASSASNQSRGWGQVSPVVVPKEPTLEEKRKSFEKNKDRLALDEKILAVEEQIEKLIAEKVALEVLRKQLE